MNNLKLIDMHNHLVPYVDDGVESFEEAIKILKLMEEDGVTDVITTPHLQSMATVLDEKEQRKYFEELKLEAKNKGVKINLYLGHELRYRDHLNPDYKSLTLAGTKYILMEFAFNNKQPIVEVVRYLKNKGLIPVIAHIERYSYLSYNDILNIKKEGAFIQVNSKSITDEDGWFSSKKTIEQMIDNEVIDIISSDTHGITNRYHSVKLAYDYLKNRSRKEYLEKITYYNAKKIIDSIENK